METYNARAPGGRVNVFCLGNQLYSEWRNKVSGQASQWLELSGIIAFRRHCLGLTMERQMQSLTRYITADIPMLLDKVNSWVKAGAETPDAETKRKIREALDKFQSETEEVRLYYSSYAFLC